MSRSTNFQCHKSVERAGKNGLCVASWVIAAFLMSYFWFVCRQGKHLLANEPKLFVVGNHPVKLPGKAL